MHYSFLLFSLCLTVLQQCQSIITPPDQEDADSSDPPSNLLTTLKHFASWKSNRDQFVKFSKDYPFGFPKFACSAPFSFLPPRDVHSLAPWHVTVVGALGDSLTAGRAAAASSLPEIVDEYRGVSFAMGGDDPLEERATIPAFLSHFSPSLVGASLNESLDSDILPSHFNVARSGAFASDLLRQAKELVRRMKVSKDVNVAKDWKFVNLFIGSNDLCKYCQNTTKYGAEMYTASISSSLSYLRDSLPRTYVNLMPSFNVRVLSDMENDNPFCSDFHRITCPCLSSMSAEEYSKLKSSFDSVLAPFMEAPYQTDTFAVAVNPVVSNLDSLPYMGSTINLAFPALDCFHFSSIAHDLVAKLVWEGLFLPVPSRSSISGFDDVNPSFWQCPPMQCPFFRTSRNTNCSVNLARWPSFAAVRAELDGQLPSQSELELRAAAEEGASLLLLVFAVVIVVVAVGVVFVAVTRKSRRTRKANETTPLLLTANLYDDVF